MITCGPHLTRLQLAAVVGVSSENCIPDIAGTLLVMLRAFGQAGRQWLQEAVAQLPEAAVTAVDRDALVGAILQSCQVDPNVREEFEQSVWCAPEFVWRGCWDTGRDASHELLGVALWA
jgi:hypothetical protein